MPSSNYTLQKMGKLIFSMIDTPGLVDFTYEVSRSLAACEGALFWVDAAYSILRQTLLPTFLAFCNDLEIMPIINKIDLPAADPESVRTEIEDVIGLDASEVQFCSLPRLVLGLEKSSSKLEKVPAHQRVM